MSVPVHERKEAKLYYLSNAEELQDLTAEIVMNDNYIPKKYRYVWAPEIFKLSMNIFQNVRRAYILHPHSNEEFQQKIQFLKNAELDTEALITQIGFARKTFTFPLGTQEKWEKLGVLTRNSIHKTITYEYRHYNKED